MQNLYTTTAITNLIDRYLDEGGDVFQVEEGVLGHGFMILYGEGLKTAIVNEVYVNEWSCGHKLRMYNTMPKKYRKMIEN